MSTASKERWYNNWWRKRGHGNRPSERVLQESAEGERVQQSAKGEEKEQQSAKGERGYEGTAMQAFIFVKNNEANTKLVQITAYYLSQYIIVFTMQSNAMYLFLFNISPTQFIFKLVMHHRWINFGGSKSKTNAHYASTLRQIRSQPSNHWRPPLSDSNSPLKTDAKSMLWAHHTQYSIWP